MKRNGFTLVEMMAVIVLIALLAVIGVATYTNVNESAKEKTLESKKEQIRTSAIKWAKENNISNKTIISVNALVVEGYLTADENEVGKIGVITNPVTGENMICNTVDISLKEGEYIAVVNDTTQNCNLATQSLVDTNISIKVVDAKNKNVTGSGSIASWTNQNVMIIVSSRSYDSRATSISYDFEGNTITKQKSGKQKYTGSSYISEAAATNYYNVFHINAALILNTKVVVTYNIAGDTSKSRAYTIRIDKEEATAIVETDNEWTTTDKKVTVKTDDGKGSGPRYFYITKTDSASEMSTANRYNATGYDKITKKLEIGRYYIWTEDRSGNVSTKPKATFELNNTDDTVPACEIIFHGNEGNSGWYKEVPVTPGAKNTVKAGISGINMGLNNSKNDPEYTTHIQYNETYELIGTKRTTETPRSGVDYYCHVKTLAGNYAKTKRNLKLDMTPPTITFETTSDTEYTQSKTIYFTVKDNLSGLPDDIIISYAWAKEGKEPNFSNTQDYGSLRKNNPYSMRGLTGAGASMTGTYYLYVDYSKITDYAGNHATGVNGIGSGGIAKLGPFMFDNTPPVCNGNNGKTTWSTGGYTIEQKCIDNDGTDDQSGCEKDTYTKVFTATQSVKDSSITIKDKAGNKTTCGFNVYIDNKRPTCAGDNSNMNWKTGDFDGWVDCSDAHSGCKKSRFTQTFTGSMSASAITIEDNVGNTKRCAIGVYIDNTAPTCYVSKTESTIGSKNGVSVYITSTDRHSGIDSSKTDHAAGGLKAGTHYFKATDMVGNTGSCSVSVTSYACDCKKKYEAYDCDETPPSDRFCNKQTTDDDCYYECYYEACSSTCYK